MKPEQKIIEKADKVIKDLFSKVALTEPLYTNLRELQADIYKHLHRVSIAHEMKADGKTVREIAEYLGYENPGSITHLFSTPTQGEGE